MRKPTFAGALVLGLAIAAPAGAEAPSFGIAAYDADDRLVETAWHPETLLVGSAAGCDLRLEGLAPQHVRFTFVEDMMMATPIMAPILVDDEAHDGNVIIEAGTRVNVGAYRLQFNLPPRARRPADTGSESGDSADLRHAAVAARAAEFDKKAYAFCNDPEYGKEGVVGVDFCAILDADSAAVCPGAERCKEWKDAPANWRFGTVGDGKSDGKGRRRIARRKRLLDFPKLPGWLGYLIIAGLIGLVVVVFVRTLLSAGWEDDDLDFSEAELSEAARKLQALPEARSQVLLRMASRALREKNDPHEAALLVHLAMLRHLDDEGLARYHPSKTNGDYLRAIRRRRDLATLFKRVVANTERIRFGDGRVDPAAVQATLDEAAAVLPRHRAGGTGEVPGLALLALAAAFGGAACGEAPGTQAYYNHGPAGMSALVPMLRAAGLDVEVRRDRLIDLPEHTGLIVLRTSAVGESAWPKEFRLDTQLDMDRAVFVIDDLGKSAIILPSTSSISSGGEARASTLELDLGTGRGPCTRFLDGMSATPHGKPVAVPRGRLIMWDGVSTTSTISDYTLFMQPFLRDTERRTVRGHAAAHGWVVHRVSDDEPLPGCLFVFADRDLFTNASLTRPGNTAFVAELFARMLPEDRTIVFADRLDQWTTSDSDIPFGGGGGGDDANPGQALQASNLLPFVVQALITLALLYIALGAAFGPLRDPEEVTHKAFVEHVEAIGRQYARMGRPGLTHSATSLAKFVVMRYRDRLRGGDAGGWASLAKELANKHDLDEAHVRAALRLGIEGKSELGAPQPGDPLPSSQEMLQTLNRLLSAQHRADKRAAAAATRRPKTT